MTNRSRLNAVTTQGQSMKRFIAAVGLCAGLLLPCALQAQTPYESTVDGSHSGNPRFGMASPRQLIFERAAYEGRQRTARIEMRKWLGHSPLRPAIAHPDYYSAGYTHWQTWPGCQPRLVMVPRP